MPAATIALRTRMSRLVGECVPNRARPARGSVMICPTCHTENRTEDRFCGECGAPLPAVNAAEGDGGVGEAPQPSLNGAVLRRVGTDDDARYKLGDRTMIGRQDTCNIVVKDPSISREHALITRLDDTYVIEDLFSTNGTTVNGRPCKGPVTLHSGDMVSVGAIDLQCAISRSMPL